MRDNIKEKVIKEADYILNTKSTIRETSKYFNVSKSTIHNDITNRLKKYDLIKYDQIQHILNYHLSVRHINGGKATKNKYAKIK